MLSYTNVMIKEEPTPEKDLRTYNIRRSDRMIKTTPKVVGKVAIHIAHQAILITVVPLPLGETAKLLLDIKEEMKRLRLDAKRFAISFISI